MNSSISQRYEEKREHVDRHALLLYLLFFPSFTNVAPAVGGGDRLKLCGREFHRSKLISSGRMNKFESL